MNQTPAPLRSVLYMPASNSRVLEKARSIPADGFVFDLEDAVAPDAKDIARDQAVAAAGSGEYGSRTIAIRCNGLDTPWGKADLAAIASAGPAAVVVPKINGARDLAEVASALERGGAPEHTAIWPMIETPMAVFAAREIAAFERVSVLLMGTLDLAKDLRAVHGVGRAAVLPHLATGILAARAEGKEILDGVFSDITDTDGFVDECRQGFELGFDGKTLVHPSQVDPANDVWSPTDAEIALAQRIILAFDEARDAGRGVITVDGQMIEHLHVQNAQRTLARAAVTD